MQLTNYSQTWSDFQGYQIREIRGRHLVTRLLHGLCSIPGYAYYWVGLKPLRA
jgi:hypothetical protein